MTPDDITRLAWSSKIIRELAALVLLRVSDKHFDADVLPREAVMAAVCKIRDATREGEAVIRTLAQQGNVGGVLGWVRPTDAAKIKDLRSGALGLYTSAQQDDIYTMPIYANPPGAGVTDEMVERARAAYYDAASVDDGVFTDPVAMRAALTAALAPQPRDAT